MRTISRTAALAIVVIASHTAVRGQQTPDPQRPVFRTGAHFVAVDAYPTRDGKARYPG